MGKFLRLFFGCHARPDRSFFFKGKQFPICSRCTGELCGMMGAIPIILFWGYFSVPYSFILTLPLIIDGTLQLKTKWVSNNPLRLFTGILAGIAIGFFFMTYHIIIVRLAISFLRHFFGDSPYYEQLLNSLMAKKIL